MDTATSDSTTDWGDQIAVLLQDLSVVQADLLKLLARKRELVVAHDSQALDQLHRDEERLVTRLRDCCQQRQQLLDQAGDQGMPTGSLQDLTNVLPGEGRTRLRPNLLEARRQARLLQHQSLANWVLVQRSLLHLSQMMEIIATGGRMRPTYGEESPTLAGGSLVDQAV